MISGTRNVFEFLREWALGAQFPQKGLSFARPAEPQQRPSPHLLNSDGLRGPVEGFDGLVPECRGLLRSAKG